MPDWLEGWRVATALKSILPRLESRRVHQNLALGKASAREYWRGKYHCTIDLLFDWFGISFMTTDNFCFYLQNRIIQTSQTGGQLYSDTPPLAFPVSAVWRANSCLCATSFEPEGLGRSIRVVVTSTHTILAHFHSVFHILDQFANVYDLWPRRDVVLFHESILAFLVLLWPKNEPICKWVC